jgi:alkanesulfonate monooxygenase SsuD/methylene tetrahydromethanopterin reductase-like flavin-dependent oxidoreductase (luciferase family)
MSSTRQLHLGAFMRPASIHTGAWRYPGAYADANFNIAHLRRFAQTLEAAKFDAFFMADHMALLNMPIDALKRSHTATSFEPFTLLSALSQVTERIGLVATGSTTFDAPYHIARRFASLDHLSGGRAGWNIVTTSNPDAALNFGLDDHMEHGERYRRAREFYEAGRQLAAETAEAVFTAQSNLAAGQRFYADVKGRMQKLGRSPDHMKILPACFVVVGETVEEARGKRAKLDSLVHYASAIASLSIALGHDASKFDPDAPLPDISESNASKSGRERTIDLARRENLTVRQLAQRLGGYSGLAMVGTLKTIADEMEEWLLDGGSDGFIVMFPYLPAGLDEPRPKNRFFSS